MKKILLLAIILTCIIDSPLPASAQRARDTRQQVIPPVTVVPTIQIQPTVVAPTLAPTDIPTDTPEPTDVPTDAPQPTDVVPAIIDSPSPEPTKTVSQNITHFFQNEPIISPFGSLLFNTPNPYISSTQRKLETIVLLACAVVYFFSGFNLLSKDTFLKTKAIREKIIYHRHKVFTFPGLRNLL